MSSDSPSNVELKDGISKLSKYFSKVIDLKEGVNKRAVIEEIALKKSMSGANSWMLMCSIVIASIGLDIDSPVIIIGAMLISPLMSPILGIGVGVGINDTDMLKDSLWQFGIAVIIAILTSTIYFIVSPFGELTEQIRLRTEPTFLDIPIAFFGGIAGIVSIARKDISTALPGVAIATALMPPLCVAGFGLSCLNWEIAASSFYLFFLNTFFVSLATYIIVRFLQFPYKQYVDQAARRKNLRNIYIISLLVTIPSFFIFMKVYERFATKLKLKEFIEEYIAEDKIYLDDYQLIKTKGKDQLVLKVYGDKISKDNIPDYQKGLQRLSIDNVDINVISTADINLDRMNFLESRIKSVDDMKAKLDAVVQQQQDIKEHNVIIDHLPAFIVNDSLIQKKDAKEIKAVFPLLKSINITYGMNADSSSQISYRSTAIVKWKNESENFKAENEKLVNYLKIKYDLKEVFLVMED